MAESTKDNPFGLRLAVAFAETPEGQPLRDFYGKVLGLKIRKAFGSTWTEYATPGANLAVHEPAGLGAEDQHCLYLSFEAEDLDGLHAHLINVGVPCSPIRKPDRGRFFTCRDPAGTNLHFISFDKKWRAASGY